MRRLGSFLFTLLAASSALAFQPATLLQHQATMQLASASEDAEKLNDMSKKWDHLRQKEKEVERSHDEVRNSECDKDFVC